jgi:four helix bundle protein
MTKIQNFKQYDLEDRTFNFAKSVALFVRQLPKITSNFEYAKQAIDASGSVGANYIEANEALSKKDFAMRIKICRKEAKESAYWLRLIIETNDEKCSQGGEKLLAEAIELEKIFSSILAKSE